MSDPISEKIDQSGASARGHGKMYRMQHHKKEIRIYVRNKARYNPETKERDFLFVDINNFAGTTIGDIKENVRHQTRNAVKIDELFLNNVPLADDRSVAHYNLEDGSILETTSNPFWVSCLYIKAAEVKQEQEGNPCDEGIQKWTAKSLPKKYTLIGVLLNSNNAYLSQPPHFPTLLDFVQYLERLNKKGATMHPNYTQADLAKMELEFHRDFENKFDDPIAAFIDHHAVQLGFINPDEAERKLRQPAVAPLNNRMVDYPTNSGAASAVTGRARPTTPAGGGAGVNRNTNKKQVHICEDCETSLAVVYCTDCLNSSDGFGICLCKRCSDLLHTGATRRRHNIADISQAPKTTNSKPYVPRAFLAPFSILLAMYSALSDRVPQLSMTEDQIKTRAQSLTDTDLQDKQNGKYVGGFDCMENVLMAKGLVKKEASREPTYALTELGRALGEKLYLFYKTLFEYLSSCRLPKLKDAVSTTCIGNRKICLLVDENEREKGRLLKYAEDKGIDAQTRYLPAGDYIWILTPPMIDTRQKYTGTTDGEVVLPFIVERKSWEDFENSVNSTRFQRQVNNMLGSGVKNCFYLMEGSPGALRYNATQQHQQHLKAMAEKLIYDYGFYVNYTTSWMKSAQWLVWFTQLIVEAFKLGKLSDITIPYSEYSSRVAQLNGGHPSNHHGNQVRRTHNWPAQLFIDHIFRDELGDISLLRAVREDLGIQGNEKHLLVIQGLEQYNKKRQSTLNKCCTEVHAAPHQAKDIVDRMIGTNIHNMVHYDITCYRQLYIQVMTGVYIMRTESDNDTLQAQQQFMAGPKPLPPQAATNRSRRKPATNLKSLRVGSPQRRDMLSTMQSLSGELHSANGDSSDLGSGASLLSPRSSINHDLPPGCSVANIPEPRQKLQGQQRSRTDGAPTLRPFSGTGHTLGSGNISQVNHRPSATVTSENQILESNNNCQGDRSRSGTGRSDFQGPQAETINRNPWRDMKSVAVSDTSKRNSLDVNERNRDKNLCPAVSHPVLNNATFETSNSTLNDGNVPNVDKYVGREDFIDSQNEDRVLQEVLNKSKQDTGTVELDSQDDPELQLALMLSSETHQHDPYNVNTNIAARESSEYAPIEIEDDSQEDVDQELKLVIERSKLENRQRDIENTKGINKQGDVFRENINDLSGSQAIRQVSSDIKTNELVDDEDKQLSLAIKMSKHINTPEKVKEQDSDHLIQEAIIRSKFDHTPHMLNDDHDFQLDETVERSKHDHSCHMMIDDADLQLKEAIERSKFDHTPQKTDNDSDLKQAIERSKYENTPKKHSDLEDEMMRVALQRSLVEQSPQRTCVKRKLDSGSVQNIPKKLMKSCEDIFEKSSDGISYTDTSSKECIIDISESQSELSANEKISCNVEDVIQIDSQSQELDMEEPEMGSRSDSAVVDTAARTPVYQDKAKYTSERDDEVKLGKKSSEIVSCPDRASFALSSAGALSNSCKRTKTAPMGSAVSEGMKISRDDCLNHVSEDEEDDLVPPSPDKNSNLLNLSQQSISNKTNATYKNTSNSSVSQERTRNENDDSLSSFRLEIKTHEKQPTTEPVYKSEENVDSHSKERSLKVDCGKGNVEKAVTPDFNLKISLLRFVDENTSDDDSASEYDEDNDDSGNENVSDESAEDIYQQDKKSTLNINSDKDTIVQDTEKVTKIMQRSKVNHKLPTTTNLVSKSLVKQTGQLLNSKTNKRTHNDSGKQNSDLIQNKEVSRNINTVETSTLETEDFVKEIKKGPSDGHEKALEDNSESNFCQRDSKGSKDTVIKKETAADIAAEAQYGKEFPDQSAYDSDLDDVDFNPYFDDSDNDPTYQTSKDDSDTSEDSDHDDIDDDIDDLISKVDPDFLPNISRPKKRRKTPNKDSSRSVRIKKEKFDNYGTKIKLEKSEILKIDTETDAALAKMLDKEINRCRNISSTCSGSSMNDEIYARQMQEDLDCHLPELTGNSEIRNEGVNAIHSEPGVKDDRQVNDQNFMTANDEEMARRLDEELNKNQLNDLNGSKVEAISGLVNELTNPRSQQNASPNVWSDNNKDFAETDGLIKELQRRELEKIDRLKRTLAEDERLAKMLQDNPNMVKETVKVEESPTLRNYRKLFSEDRAMREKSAAQVEEYRKLQSQRFQSVNTQQYPGGNKLVAKVPFVPPKTDRPVSSMGQTPAYDRFSQSQSTDLLTPDNYNLQSQSSSLPFSQSQASHLTPCGQSKPTGERSINSRCGNCEEKGHTRKDPKCPKYHTAEESARREAQQERRRQQQEEKKREELENINMLARHQKAILDMNNELETEISTIQNNLRQRAVELEKQVNSRVKRIENAEKRKKKK